MEKHLYQGAKTVNRFVLTIGEDTSRKAKDVQKLMEELVDTVSKIDKYNMNN